MASSDKVYVDVTAVMDSLGRIWPRSLTWEDGRVYEIDRLVSVKPSFSQKVGGQGDLYLVKIRGAEIHLYFEHNPDCTSALVGRWFVARALNV